MVSEEAVASCVCKKPCLPALSSNPERLFVCGHPVLSCPYMKPQTFDPLCPWRPLCDIEPFQSFLSCPAAGQPAPRDLSAIFCHLFFADKPLPPGCRAARSRPPGSWAAGVYSCKFPNRKYIFVKNENKKIKKPRQLCVRMDLDIRILK